MSKIPYDLSLIKAIAFDVDGVLSPAVVPLGDDGIPRRMANIKDGFALKLAGQKGLKIAIISGGTGEGLAKRFQLLGISDVFLGVGSKIDLLRGWMSTYGLKPENVAFVGDDVPDSACMKEVGLAVSPADGAPEIQAIANYITPCIGGHGVARDVIEEVLRARSEWPEVSDASF